eukprot:TRINITY_DN495_c0_g1_i1.p1 TRINITY_DN495_c0_g1~~TRINITY_DN495_c0_g1_i1.p1  ORF type:complete len:121 (-),score=11.24 TRINITY_DN495_c0_g1_i1:228-590(-)
MSSDEIKEHPVVAARRARQNYMTYEEDKPRKGLPPLIVAGCVATMGTLAMQAYSFGKGDSHNLQFWMRMRLVGHGTTMLLIFAGFSQYLYKTYLGEDGFVDKFIFQKESKQPQTEPQPQQ